MKKRTFSKWNILYVVLAALMLLSLFAVPRIILKQLEADKNRIVVTNANEGRYEYGGAICILKSIY